MGHASTTSVRFSPSSPWPEHGGFATDMEARPCHCFCAWKNTGFHVNHVSAVSLEYAGTVILKFRQEGRFCSKSASTFGRTFGFPMYVPQVGGNRLGGLCRVHTWHPTRGLGLCRSKAGSVSWPHRLNTRLSGSLTERSVSVVSIGVPSLMAVVVFFGF